MRWIQPGDIAPLRPGEPPPKKELSTALGWRLVWAVFLGTLVGLTALLAGPVSGLNGVLWVIVGGFAGSMLGAAAAVGLYLRVAIVRRPLVILCFVCGAVGGLLAQMLLAGPG